MSVVSTYLVLNLASNSESKTVLKANTPPPVFFIINNLKCMAKLKA